MQIVSDDERSAFFDDVRDASAKATWSALATNSPSGPRVRIVHPTWEGKRLWFATGTSSPKVKHLREDPRVDLQYQVAPPDFVHVMVRGTAKIVTDGDEKKRVWDVIDYDLGMFWPGGPTDPGFTLVRIVPDRIELSKMFGSTDQRVWRREAA